MLFVCGRISTERMSCARSAFWKTVFFWMPSNDPRRNESVICWKNVPSFAHVRMHTERARGEKIAEQFHRFHTFPLFIFMIFISISLLFCIKASQKKTKWAESRLCLRDCHSICHDSKMVKWKSFAWLLMLMSHSCHNCQHMCTMFVVRHIHQLECRIRYTESIPTKFIHKILAVNVLQSIDWVNLWDLAPSNVIEHISGVPTNKQSNIA